MVIDGRSGWILSGVATGSLLTGGIFYLLFRSSSTVYFLADIFLDAGNYSISSGNILNSMPSFLHVYAFILLTAVVLNPSRTGLILICFGWMGVELFFEIGQHPFLAQSLTDWVPAWFAGFPYLEVASTYFLSGTFDPVDVLFIIIGAAAALLTLYKVQHWEVSHG
ncbi:MAG: hypothetical protein OQK98_09365 [Gammaproteobacteria bacterium]|nr:hypothetical protein [Gammaproteobacteria bacterium]